MLSSFKNLDELSRRSMMQNIAGMTLGVSAAMPNAFSASSASSSKGKKIVRIFLPGGMTHIDSFDPKASVSRNHGQHQAHQNQYRRRNLWILPYACQANG